MLDRRHGSQMANDYVSGVNSDMRMVTTTDNARREVRSGAVSFRDSMKAKQHRQVH